jgi:hypothetical protein
VRESTVETALKSHAESLGCIVLKLNGHGNRGKQDRWIGYEGRSLFLEVKKPGEVPTALQDWWRERMIGYGFTAKWCDNVADGIRIINEFVNPTTP